MFERIRYNKKKAERKRRRKEAGKYGIMVPGYLYVSINSIRRSLTRSTNFSQITDRCKVQPTSNQIPTNIHAHRQIRTRKHGLERSSSGGKFYY